MAFEHDRVSRRSFVKGSLVPVVAPLAAAMVSRAARSAEQATVAVAAGPEIVDTNIHLFDWPFRKLKYARTEALVTKLRSLPGKL